MNLASRIALSLAVGFGLVTPEVRARHKRLADRRATASGTPTDPRSPALGPVLTVAAAGAPPAPP
ncbi:MAG TPA: hypothetical protein VJM11_07365 [Nevskiaceae bacterium]|nr:hypothetical protein [Nevskiaceae bacterium]